MTQIKINTFSIVAYDPADNAWGVAVASKFLAVGAVVSWAQAGVGAVATQALANMHFGPGGLALLAEGKSARETLDILLANDKGTDSRQVGIVDAQGGSAAHTGKACQDWAGHKLGEGFTCQGNILTGPETIEALAITFQNSTGELGDRLVSALQAAESAGGDKRGKQSAAVLVVRANSGYGGETDRYMDLRVDDDPDPVRKLKKLVETHHLFFGKPKADDQMPINEELARELQNMLIKQGYYGGMVDGTWDEMSKQAFWMMIGNENLEERWDLNRQPDMIDRVALNYLRERFK